MEAKFYSVTKLINEIKTTNIYEEHQPKKVILWFESDVAFKKDFVRGAERHKFKQQCIKPIAITFKGDKSLTLTHKTLLDTFDGAQPIVSFVQTKKKYIPKTKKNELSYLSIDTEQKEYDGKEYYPCRTGTTTNMKVIKNILDKKIDEDFDNEINDIGDELGDGSNGSWDFI